MVVGRRRLSGEGMYKNREGKYGIEGGKEEERL